MTLVDHLAALVLERGARRTGIDGVDCAGKTTLARALADRIGAALVSVDDHLRPEAVRKVRGDLDPEGCYRDSYDATTFREAVLHEPGRVVAEGVFLLRPELHDLWDLTVRLEVTDDEVLRRAHARDGGRMDVELRYRRRYLPAQELYLREAAVPDVVVDATDWSAPVVLRG